MAGDRLVDRLTYLRVLRYITWAPGLQMSTRVMKPNNYRIEIQNQELSNNVSHLRLLVGQWWVGGTSTNRETRKSLRNPGRRNIDHKDLGVFGGLSLYCPLNYMRSLVYDLSIYHSDTKCHVVMVAGFAWSIWMHLVERKLGDSSYPSGSSWKKESQPVFPPTLYVKALNCHRTTMY